MIINPNATISLGAPLPSQPDKLAAYQLPADPITQGVARLDPQTLGLVVWVLTMHILKCEYRIDRLERLAARMTVGDGELEDIALGAQLVEEVRARREAEAKAREHEAAKEGAH